VIVNDSGLGSLYEAVMRAVDRLESGADELLRLCLTPCAEYVE
jgi:hypothetical protein